MPPTTLPNLPRVKACIAYIESCGWKLQYYNRPWYVFRHPTRTPAELVFTLTELRDTFTNGF